MKPILTLIAALLLCSTIAAMEDTRPYTIQVIVWDTDGNREADVPVTFAYSSTSETIYSAEDGTLSFGVHNFGSVPDGAEINVSCKHGAKDVPVNHAIGSTGVTFNEPSSATAIAAFAAMGFAAILVLGRKGIYLLKRKKKDEP